MRIADLRGLDAVSMGNVASKLASSIMARYYYVPSERDLLNLRRLKRRPWIGALRTLDREYGPGCIWSLESFPTRLSQRGLGVQAASRMLSAPFVFVNGVAANEIVDREGAQPRERQPSATRQVAFSAAALATGEFPYVASFAQSGVESSNDESFVRGFRWLSDGMAAVVPSKKRTLRGPPGHLKRPATRASDQTGRSPCPICAGPDERNGVSSLPGSGWARPCIREIGD